MTNITKSRSSFYRVIFPVLVALTVTFSVPAISEDKILAKNFIDKAVAMGIADISSAKLALEQSDAQEVKAYAQRIINNSKDINKVLTDLAAEKKVAIANTEHLAKKAEQKMVKPNEESFDVSYARNQIHSIQEKIDLFQRAADSEDYDVRTAANVVLPKLRQQLLMAEQLVSATAETKTDIYQDRKNQVNTETNPGIDRVPTTDKNL